MKFEDLHMRQESRDLYKTIAKLFPKSGSIDYFFRDQLLRATLSISNNIAEGFERDTDKELIRFLYIAKGSCGECRSMLHILHDEGFVNQDEYGHLLSQCHIISSMIYNYIKKVKAPKDGVM